MTSLRISSCDNIDGEIPNFATFDSLEYLTLYDNNLEGEIPNFTNLPLLEHLTLYGNNLRGEIPNFTYLPKLEGLGLNENNLTGEVPSFPNCPLLNYLNLSDNLLIGQLPSLDNLTELSSLHLSHNNLDGPLLEYNHLSEMRILNLGNNALSGPIPEYRHFKLQSVRLDSNALTGRIPDLLLSPNLFALFLEHNDLDGCYSNVHCVLASRFQFCEDSITVGCRYDFRDNPKLPWEGDYARHCAGEEQIGAACDDGNSQTVDDQINNDCLCEGIGTDSVKDYKPEEIIIHPNPVAHTLYLTTNLSEITYRIYNAHGITNCSGQTSNSINLGDLPAGLYWIELSSLDQEYKIVKSFIKSE